MESILASDHCSGSTYSKFTTRSKFAIPFIGWPGFSLIGSVSWPPLALYPHLWQTFFVCSSNS